MKLIAQFGNGVDNIDVEAAYAAGITVTNTPSVLTEDTADMAMMLMLALPRRLVEGAEVLPLDGHVARLVADLDAGPAAARQGARHRRHGPDRHARSRRGRRPSGSPSTISRATAGRRQIEERLEATYWPTLDEMLGAVDIVSLHTPHTRDTFHILDAARMDRMRDRAFVVNVSRPELIDEAGAGRAHRERASSRARRSMSSRTATGSIRGCWSLARQHKVVLTAHMASATLEARVEMGETVIVNIRAFVDGHQPPHRVLPEQVGRLRAEGA